MTDNYFFDTPVNILENQELREPQVNAYVEAYNHFITDNKLTHAIIVLPTGVGKTGLISILPYKISSGRVLIITPQLTIRDNIEDKLDSRNATNFWTEKGIISSPKKLPTVINYDKELPDSIVESADIVIANIQKLQKRNQGALLNKYKSDFFDMIIIDEAHHAEANTWLDNLGHFDKAKVIKLTATAYRTDDKPLVGELIYKYKLSQAMSKGYVKSLEKFDFVPNELKFIIDKESSKEYTYNELLEKGIRDEHWISRSVAFSDSCINDIVKESVRILNEKKKTSSVPHKIIAVAQNIEEANKICQIYVDNGMRAIAVHNDMDKGELNSKFNDIENNRVDVVVNVSMMGEGYDHKYFSVAAIFRPFRSPLPYEQFVGRILRIIPEGNVSDNIGSVVAHKFLYLNKLWDYYKTQINESKIIKDLPEVIDGISDINKFDSGSDSNLADIIEIGTALSGKGGHSDKEVYMQTEYIKEQERQEAKYNLKVKKIMEALGIDRGKAEKFVSETEDDQAFKRPDIMLKHRRKTTDKNIKEVIVPEILDVANVELKGTELMHRLPIFKDGKYNWIIRSAKTQTNAACLAIYFSQYLQLAIGKSRKEWDNDDYANASKKLDQQAKYIKSFFEDGEE